MKKMLMFLGLAVVCATAQAEELRPQFRAWKSSALQGGNYNPTLLSTSPIIFHMVVGSAAVQGVGTNSFVLLRSTRSPLTTDASTKAFVSLNNSGVERSGLDDAYDVFSDSYTFYTKTGPAVINILWDYYKYPYWDLNPKD